LAVDANHQSTGNQGVQGEIPLPEARENFVRRGERLKALHQRWCSGFSRRPN